MRSSLGVGILSVVALTTIGSLAGATGQSAVPAPQTSDSDTAAISGVVSDAVTGRPIAGASVILFGVAPGEGRPDRPC